MTKSYWVISSEIGYPPFFHYFHKYIILLNIERVLEKVPTEICWETPCYIIHSLMIFYSFKARSQQHTS
jgi:hypothetical protein